MNYRRALLLVFVVVVAVVALGWNSIKPAKPQTLDSEKHLCKLEGRKSAELFTDDDELKRANLDEPWKTFKNVTNAARKKLDEPPLVHFVLVPCGEKDSMQDGDTLYATVPYVLAFVQAYTP